MIYKGPFQLKSLSDTMTICLSLIRLYATSSILCHASVLQLRKWHSPGAEKYCDGRCEDFLSVDKNSNSTAVSMQYLPVYILTLKLKHAFVLQLLSTYCLYWNIYKRKWSWDSYCFSFPVNLKITLD